MNDDKKRGLGRTAAVLQMTDRVCMIATCIALAVLYLKLKQVPR